LHGATCEAGGETTATPPDRLPLTSVLRDLDDTMQELNRSLEHITLNPSRFTRQSQEKQASITIAAGQKKKIFEFDKTSGLIDHVFIDVTRKDAKITVLIDREEIVFTPEELAEDYFTLWNPRTFYLLEYDEGNNEFKLFFAPVPLREFTKLFELSITAPAAGSVTVFFEQVHYTEGRRR
jgi:uncharacterized protein (DUF2344 family)